MKYIDAVLRIGKLMGESQFHNYMGGAMLPRPQNDIAEIISIIYDKNVHKVREKLNNRVEIEFEKCLKRKPR